ncbi:coiled-coil domain-containing protein 201-like [Dipodomys merriami]|uniref:coiled-coil domain-containing protein 201-like n=1 Tax=Dipodomys merriami TaxID=94247 RepID=UPI00384E9BEA
MKGLNSGQESPALQMGPPLRKPIKQKTPEEASFSRSPRSPEVAPYIEEEGPGDRFLLSACTSQDFCRHLAGIGSTAASTKRRPILQASEVLHGQLGSGMDPLVPGEESTAFVRMAQQQRQKQKQESFPKGSQNSRVPRNHHTVHRGRWGPMKPAAAMERVRQWESILLQNIEEATQHHLTVEIEKNCSHRVPV